MSELTIRLSAPPVPWIRQGLKVAFLPLLGLVLGADSVPFATHAGGGQGLANGITIAYFLVMLWGLRPEERRAAIVFVPFSAIAEYLFSQVFDLYLYRLGAVPLYVPFGHAILLSTGLILAELTWLTAKDTWRWGLLSLHLCLFTGAIAIFHDGLSAIMLGVFAWILHRKGVRLLYLIMGLLVLLVELTGTAWGVWVWQPEAWGIIHTTNPPFGAFVFYVLGDLGGLKLSRWVSILIPPRLHGDQRDEAGINLAIATPPEPAPQTVISDTNLWRSPQIPVD